MNLCAGCADRVGKAYTLDTGAPTRHGCALCSCQEAKKYRLESYLYRSAKSKSNPTGKDTRARYKEPWRNT